MSWIKKTNFGKYAYEMISIILGVLVALGVDQWNEDRENNQRVEIAISNVQKELFSNNDILNILHPRNQKVLEIIKEHTEDDTTLSFVPGLQLQETAWGMMQNSGISAYIEYDKLFEIAQIYSIQKIYKDFSGIFIKQYMETQSMAVALGKELTDEEMNNAHLELIELLVSVESSLLESTHQYLAENGLLESENDDPPVNN
ncbi:MAG: hypothetical protein K9M55_09090 [Candidatus Marinimicrobia bacterium]|nr:hypothetical protein [Candidatus Neomarinimicrobiota bacterium]